jgi:hypothetical protein
MNTNKGNVLCEMEIKVNIDMVDKLSLSASKYTHLQT